MKGSRLNTKIMIAIFRGDKINLHALFRFFIINIQSIHINNLVFIRNTNFSFTFFRDFHFNLKR